MSNPDRPPHDGTTPDAGDDHLRSLARMYERAPINALYVPQLTLSPGQAEISMPSSTKFMHAAGAMHGSFYFKGLDDAAWFAAATLEREYFLLTTAFTTYITRPVSNGQMRVQGRVVSSNRTQFIAEAVAVDDAGREVARASGLFVRSKLLLSTVAAYGDGSS